MKREQSSRVVIVVELGGEWPPWISESADGPERRVVAEREGEPPEALCERLGSVLETLARDDARLKSAIVVTNQRTDARQMARRRALLEALGAAADKRTREIVLAPPTEASPALRQALGALAADVARPGGPRIHVGNGDGTASRPFATTPLGVAHVA
ncbi:MAG: hypothetical protein DIU78_021755 [Pseudomonadota bacterium]